MPTPLKNTGNMRKHLTKAERDARQAAEEELRTSGRVVVKAPDWLSAEARKVFDVTKVQMRKLGVLEAVDTELLALYADAICRYREVIKSLDMADPKAAAAAQAWSRLALQYAEKMGISATGRARLAKKKAVEQPLDPMEELLGEVTDYLNGDQ